jgi:exonuclease I
MTRGQSEEVLNYVLQESTIKKLILRRRNRVKTLVSELTAKETDQWELYCPHEKIEPPKVRVELDRLVTHAAENSAFYDTILRSLKSSSQPYITLEYECLGSELEQERILDFLRVSSVRSRLTPVSIKQTPADLRVVISNFTELETALSGTEYHRELNDTDH